MQRFPERHVSRTSPLRGRHPLTSNPAASRRTAESSPRHAATESASTSSVRSLARGEPRRASRARSPVPFCVVGSLAAPHLSTPLHYDTRPRIRFCCVLSNQNQTNQKLLLASHHFLRHPRSAPEAAPHRRSRRHGTHTHPRSLARSLPSLPPRAIHAPPPSCLLSLSAMATPSAVGAACLLLARAAWPAAVGDRARPRRLQRVLRRRCVAELSREGPAPRPLPPALLAPPLVPGFLAPPAEPTGEPASTPPPVPDAGLGDLGLEPEGN
jgi:hypothetical protein